MKRTEIKGCPFCGGKAELKINAQTLNARASCKACNVEMKRSFKGSKRIEEVLEELMVIEWNRRENNV